MNIIMVTLTIQNSDKIEKEIIRLEEKTGLKHSKKNLVNKILNEYFEKKETKSALFGGEGETE